MTLIASTIRRVTTTSTEWLYKTREGIIGIAAIGGGAVLALGLYSPLRDLTIAIAGTGVFFIAIIIDPLKGLALWLATQPLLEGYLNISLGAGIPDLSLTRLCIALLTVLLLARTAIRSRRLQSINKFDLLALVFMLGMAQSGFRGSRGLNSLQNIFDLYFVPVLVYFAVKNLVSDRRSMHLVLYAALSVALYSAVYAFYESITGNILLASRTYDYYFYESGLRILRGIWGSNVGFGRVFVMTIPILFYFLLKNPSPSRKFFFAICLALVFGGLYLTYKRTAWIAMLAVVFVMQFFYPQFRKLFVVLALVVAIALALNWNNITSSMVYTDRINSQNSTSKERTDGWNNGIAIWLTNPVIGVGYHQYQSHAIKAGYDDKDLESEHLEILVSSGLLGFLPYVGMLLLMVYDGYKHFQGRVAASLADPDLVAVLWGILTGYVITSATSQINNLAINAILFAAAGAIIYARHEVASTKPELKQRIANFDTTL
jgi:O-antigen ligase